MVEGEWFSCPGFEDAILGLLCLGTGLAQEEHRDRGRQKEHAGRGLQHGKGLQAGVKGGGAAAGRAQGKGLDEGLKGRGASAGKAGEGHLARSGKGTAVGLVGPLFPDRPLWEGAAQDPKPQAQTLKMGLRVKS